MMRRRFLSILAVVVLVTLAGCGGVISDEATSPDETAGPTPESAGETGDERTASPNGTLSVTFINVGQGSSTLIVGPTNETMLIDSGTGPTTAKTCSPISERTISIESTPS